MEGQALDRHQAWARRSRIRRIFSGGALGGLLVLGVWAESTYDFLGNKDPQVQVSQSHDIHTASTLPPELTDEHKHSHGGEASATAQTTAHEHGSAEGTTPTTTHEHQSGPTTPDETHTSHEEHTTQTVQEESSPDHSDHTQPPGTQPPTHEHPAPPPNTSPPNTTQPPATTPPETAPPTSAPPGSTIPDPGS
jgi:hypothetical protein